jgi:competence protein ComEC
MEVRPRGLRAPTILFAAAMLAACLLVQTRAELPAPVLMLVAAGLGCACLVVGWLLAWARPHPIRLALSLALWTLAFGLCGWSWAAWRAELALEQRLPARLEGLELQIAGIVRGLPQPGSFGLRFEFDVLTCTPDCGPLGRVSLGAPKGIAAVRPGDHRTFVVRLKRPHASINPGAFDREQRWLQEGIDAVGHVRREIPAPAERHWGLAIQIEDWRQRLRDAMTHSMVDWADRWWSATEQGSEGTLLALAVGDQAAIDQSHWRVFNRTGVGHLMSISGLHITALAGMAGLLAGRFWRSGPACRAGLPLRLSVQQVRWSVAMLVGLFYAALAGWGIPAQRTAFMLTVAALLNLFGRSQGMSTVLSCAMIVVLLLDPWAALTPGFWLSFGAVSMLVWAGQGAPMRQKPASEIAARLASWFAALRTAARTQWAATVAMLPLGLLFFGNVSVIGPIANAFAIPLVSVVITPAALLGAALSAVHPALGGWVLGPSLWLTDLLLAGLHRLSDAQGAVWLLPRPPLWVVLVSALGMVHVLAPRGVPVRLAGVLAMIPLAFVPADRPRDGVWRLTALDVGQGTAAVLQARDYTLLYDTGPASPGGSDAGAQTLLPWLQRAGIGRISLLMVSHLDLDHSGGLRSMLSGMQVHQVMASFDVPAWATAAGAPVPAAWQPCERHTRWAHAGVRFTVLHPRQPPEPSRGSSTNAVSCVLRIDGPGWRILLTGDIEAAQERRLLEVFDAEELRADILLVPHHGSITSSTEAFLDAVQPRHAIFQAAYRSRYRHPHPKVLERYARRGIQVWRSDANGAITVELAPGAAPRVQTARQSPARYWRVKTSPDPAD